MARSKRETERKYDAPSADDTSWLPELTRVEGMVSVVGQRTDELDAVYGRARSRLAPEAAPVAGQRERELPAAWADASKRGLRKALGP